MRKQVSIGERYRDRSAVWTQWEVQRIYVDLLGLPHAIVSGVSGIGDDMERRTIACPTLLDRRRFELVDEGETTALPPATRPGNTHRARGGLAAISF